MPLEPEVITFLKQYYNLGFPPVQECTPEEARQMLRVNSNLDDPREEVFRVTDVDIPTRSGGVRGRHYRPSAAPSLGGMMYFHGGGWVCGDLDTHDAFCRRLANACGFSVVSVDYRRAPETSFPGGTEDCFDATQWAREQAAELGIDPARLVICGDSAGGNIAAGVTLLSRDREQPLPALQVLLYPVVDADFQRSSYKEFAEGYLLTRDAMKWFWDCYVPDHGDRHSAIAAPLRAEHLGGLPPALVITAECDVLRDEGNAFAQRLREAGGAVEHTCYEGMIHGFLNRFQLFAAARTAIDQIAAAVARLECGPRGRIGE